jgi:outer membrane murein-binding lipoprotein Lpp
MRMGMTRVLAVALAGLWLSGCNKRARDKLAEAQRKDPSNRFVANNIQLLEESQRQGKAIE